MQTASGWQLGLGLLIILMAVYAVARRMDVRLALFPAALALGVVAGKPTLILQAFFSKLADFSSVVPICCAMGFAFVLRHTGCDVHLVQALVRPIRKMRGLLVPGAVCVGFLVNIPIISQTSAAVAIGSVLMPLLFAAGVSPVTAGAAMLLGASIGGELLNPGAPEYTAVIDAVPGISKGDCVARVLPIVLLHLAISTAIFWLLSRRLDARAAVPANAPESAESEAEPALKVNPAKAFIPLLPLLILFLVGKPLELVKVDPALLVNAPKEVEILKSERTQAQRAGDLYDARLIGIAMLIGVAAATLTTLFKAEERDLFFGTARAFFDGTGYAFKEVIAVIVVATCFSEGIKIVGIGEWISQGVGRIPALLLPASGVVPLGLGMLSGSGIAATQGVYKFFVPAAQQHGIDLVTLGVLVSVSAAAGRTMSPVSAVNIMCARLASEQFKTELQPQDLTRRVVPPLLIGLAFAFLLGRLLMPTP